MLTISPDAAQAIKQIVDSSGVGEDGGLRLSVQPLDEQTANLELSVTDSPGAQDARIEEAGANVYVDPAAAQFLDDKVLGASQGEQGLAFSIVEKQA